MCGFLSEIFAMYVLDLEEQVTFARVVIFHNFFIYFQRV